MRRTRKPSGAPPHPSPSLEEIEAFLDDVQRRRIATLVGDMVEHTAAQGERSAFRQAVRVARQRLIAAQGALRGVLRLVQLGALLPRMAQTASKLEASQRALGKAGQRLREVSPLDAARSLTPALLGQVSPVDEAAAQASLAREGGGGMPFVVTESRDATAHLGQVLHARLA